MRRFLVILLLLICFRPLLAQDDDFYDDEAKPANPFILGTMMVITGTVGYAGGAALGTLTGSALCSGCTRFGRNYNTTMVSSLTLSTAFVTAAFISGTAQAFKAPTNFGWTLLGTSVGAALLPTYFYTQDYDTSELYGRSLVAGSAAIVTGIVMYFLTRPADLAYSEKGEVAFTPFFGEASGATVAYRF